MLENFTVDTFAPLVGQVFIVHLDATSLLHLELIDAVATGSPDPAANKQTGRSFSLVFRGPRAPVLVQRIYSLEHAALGSFELFLVPIGPDEHGMLYEVVFN